MRAMERRVNLLEGPVTCYLTLEEALHRLDHPEAFPGKDYSPAMVEALRSLAETD